MKILKVIHGYPPYYSAGSEVYSQTLVHELANEHEVQLLSRYENSFLPDFHYRTLLDPSDARVLLHLINVPTAKYHYNFINEPVNALFKSILATFQPDLIHFGHLSHLSMELPNIAVQAGIPTIFTLHDFWLMCPRGRFIQRNATSLFPLCNGQADQKCATQCYKGYFTGDSTQLAADITYWATWVGVRMEQARKIIKGIDHFIAPSRFLQRKFIQDFHLPAHKVSYLDYGFDLSRFTERQRIPEALFVFGYIGTHTPEKGIDLLLRAFAKLSVRAQLNIWGASREETAALKAIVQQFPSAIQERIKWMGPYANEAITAAVFDRVDAIVVPSIWGENAPLVIHEAQQLRVPVLTADYGGMAEYVKDGINGLLFKHRNVTSLAAAMQRLATDPVLYGQLMQTGYLYSADGNIPSIQEHVNQLQPIYHAAINSKGKTVATKQGPWRITFDTNPDHCNFACIMCEGFSPYSKVKATRKAQGIRARVMPIETLRKVIQEAAGTALREIIPSTMGEPLLYKHFTEIIALCHEFGLKLNLTTNGSFPIKGAQQWAELLVPVLSDIKISWNGATKETHEAIMSGSKWEEVVTNLQTFLQVRDAYFQSTGKRCSVTLQLTFLESNLTELYALVKMAITMGIDRVKGHHLWAHFKEIKGLSMRRNHAAIDQWNKVVQQLYLLRDQLLLPNGTQIKLVNFTLLPKEGIKDLAVGGPCPFLGKEAWISPEGKFSPCCAPDALRETLGNFGNIHEVKLEDIWKSDAYTHLQKNYLKHPLCKGCNMRKPLVS
ncbi:glycosyltransferase [Candidatus Cardinium hertigii]|uniref:D-inositol 3-phosphate glycosyltransferase n=1 Tax=Candidatus Cardinium hertigii TaxID=247481 RepID=A0A2Z3LHU5_9BACT|nr:glycosyltransferase [Candidatus Cardinium hertigii]AWN81620.1 D-inositol 3-phosphate glycosyltransferase [Candidatus Cardinium hertigii]